MQEALAAAESNFAAQQAARAEADQKWQVAMTELEKIRAELAAYQKTAEAEKTTLTKRADDAERRLRVVSDELQSLKHHISRMTSAIFDKHRTLENSLVLLKNLHGRLTMLDYLAGERNHQLSSDSLVKLKAVYSLAE